MSDERRYERVRLVDGVVVDTALLVPEAAAAMNADEESSGHPFRWRPVEDREVGRIEQIQHVQPFSVIRVANGRLGIAPNRANRGMYHVLFCDERNSGTILRPHETVEVVELAVKVCWDRVVQLRKEEELDADDVAFAEVLLGRDGAKQMRTLCANCGVFCGDLVLAGLAVEVDGMAFCGEGCHDEWLDKQSESE